MLALKLIVFVAALFTSLLYVNNITADLASLIAWGTTYHSPDELKEKDKIGVTFAKERLILAIITSICWGVFAIL